jgi:hypothetical protein
MTGEIITHLHKTEDALFFITKINKFDYICKRFSKNK